jgi:hypothetical protein
VSCWSQTLTTAKPTIVAAMTPTATSAARVFHITRARSDMARILKIRAVPVQPPW